MNEHIIITILCLLLLTINIGAVYMCITAANTNDNGLDDLGPIITSVAIGFDLILIVSAVIWVLNSIPHGWNGVGILLCVILISLMTYMLTKLLRKHANT